jgi:uncharacterized protein (DUF2147 family)
VESGHYAANSERVSDPKVQHALWAGRTLGISKLTGRPTAGTGAQMRAIACSLVAALGFSSAAAISAPMRDQSSIEGIWRSPQGNSILRIASCQHSVCGTIAWATDSAKQKSRKTTPHLVGTYLLTDLEDQRDGSWLGKLFIPDKNLHVTAKIRRVSRQELQVSGCIIICKSAVWTAFTQLLPRDTSKPAPK